MIYFIEAVGLNVVKIGFTDDVAARISKIQSDCPCYLLLLGSRAGNAEDEAALHERFAQFRIRGEWFAKTEDIVTEAIETDERQPKLPPEPRPPIIPLTWKGKLEERAAQPETAVSNGHLLAQFRLEKRITQEVLGKALGVHKVTICRWESNERPIPVERIKQVVQITGLRPEQLRPDVYGSAQ